VSILPTGQNNTRVLCVDDNPDIADTEAMLLSLVGFDARACYGARDALAEAATFFPSVCLIDMSMPGMNGDELAAVLRDRANERPLVLIAVTALTADPGRDVWFDFRLLKPVESETLLAAVISLTRGHRRTLPTVPPPAATISM
jgi:CheY-like chemotaxis protein